MNDDAEQHPTLDNTEQDGQWKTISTKHRVGGTARLTKSQPSSGASTPNSSHDKSHFSWSELVQSQSDYSQSPTLRRPTSAHPTSTIPQNAKDESVVLPASDLNAICIRIGDTTENTTRGPVGLINYGNRCYLNASLQFLLNCEPFIHVMRSLFDRLPYIPSSVFIRPFGCVTERYVSCQEGPFVPTELINYFVWKRKFDDNKEQDVQEFLTFVLDELHRCMIQEKDVLKWSLDSESKGDDKDEGEWLEVGKKGVVGSRTMTLDPSPISALFFGRTRSLIERVKGKNSCTIEPFHCLSLEINDSSITTLESALLRMAKVESIEDANIRKSLRLEHLPPVLLIHFKRFIYSHETGVRKLNGFVSYPAEFIPSTNILHGRVIQESGEYYLAAVIYHHGRNTESGHYTVHLRRSDTTTWYFVDDDHVTENVSMHQVLQDKGVSQTAYMLMYIKKNLSQDEHL